ncbi:hypothetical protein G6F56_005002 [Rhizopus delemar]|nr:hypothetical protein G6F56_005002 [Rhizopus delemar]
MEKTREYLEVIINQCLSQCAVLSDGNGSFGPELTFLLQYLNPSTYKTKNIIDPVYLIDLHNPILQSVAQCILKSTLCQFQLRDCFLRYVQQIVKNQNHSLQQDKQKLNATILWLTTMTRLTLYPIEHAELTSDSLDMATASMFLWTNTLAVPGIISIVSSTKMIVDRLKKWTLGAVTPFLLNSTNKNVCMDRLGGNGCLFLLGNIIDLWGDNGGDQMELVNLISSFLQYIKKYFSDKQTTLFPNRHPVFKWSNAKWGNTLSFSVFERVIKQMEYIWSRPFMDQLFYDIIHFDFNTVDTPKRSLFSIKLGKRIVQEKASSGRKMALFSMEIESVFSMYSSLISTFKSQSNVILYRIAFTKDLVSQLWKVMNLFGPKGNMQIYLDASKRSDISKEPLIKSKVKCESNHKSRTLDDSDIFQHHTPFSPDDLVWMSGFLNSFYFSLIQQQTSIPTELPLAAVSFKSARRLLLQIYDLDLHHPFCPPNHWLLISGMSNRMKSLVSSVFTKEESSGSLFLSNLSQGDPVPLRILQLMPHTVPFNVRLKAFRDWIALDRSSTKKTQSTLITVRRHGVLLDGYQQLSSLSASAWKGDIRVSFMNEIGMDRVGVNQGRPLKDFVTMLISEVFRPNHGLFAATEQNSFYPNPYSSVYGKNHIQLFEFIGKV